MEKSSNHVSKKKSNYMNKGLLKEEDEIIIHNGKAAKDNYSWVMNNNDELDYSVGDGSGDMVGGFSWPPRCYICTFCKREFRSAQALGGHMNVHRRDRARLRQMPISSTDLPLPLHPAVQNYSLLNLNLDPSPNPNPNRNPKFSTYFSSFTSTNSMLSPSSPSSLPFLQLSPDPSYRLRHPRVNTANLTIMKSQIPPFGVLNEDELKIASKSEILRLNLEIDLLGHESKSDDLDLELRLGCS